jgi:hypothetical protein
MNSKKGWSKLLVIVLILIVGILAWGIIGGQEAQSAGVTCDMGLGESLCWKWHNNILGQIQEGISDTGNVVKDFFDK